MPGLLLAHLLVLSIAAFVRDEGHTSLSASTSSREIQ